MNCFHSIFLGYCTLSVQTPSLPVCSPCLAPWQRPFLSPLVSHPTFSSLLWACGLTDWSLIPPLGAVPGLQTHPRISITAAVAVTAHLQTNTTSLTQDCSLQIGCGLPTGCDTTKTDQTKACSDSACSVRVWPRHPPVTRHHPWRPAMPRESKAHARQTDIKAF